MLFCFAPAVKVNNQVYRAVDNRAYLGAPSCVISYDMTNIGLSGDTMCLFIKSGMTFWPTSI